tara:strand:- start:328 stop:525 length:198 start_codon:yes stop_codon:yes gene_type:complete
MKGIEMDEKTQKYINGLISMLTRQRNQALDVSAKLQAEMDVLKAELAPAPEATETEEKPEDQEAE